MGSFFWTGKNIHTIPRRSLNKGNFYQYAKSSTNLERNYGRNGRTGRWFPSTWKRNGDGAESPEEKEERNYQDFRFGHGAFDGQ